MASEFPEVKVHRRIGCQATSVVGPSVLVAFHYNSRIDKLVDVFEQLSEGIHCEEVWHHVEIRIWHQVDEPCTVCLCTMWHHELMPCWEPVCSFVCIFPCSFRSGMIRKSFGVPIHVVLQKTKCLRSHWSGLLSCHPWLWHNPRL